MVVTDVGIAVVTRELPDAPSNPRIKWTAKAAVIVAVRTDEGITGIGEAWCSGGTPWPVVAAIEHDLAPLIVGEDPTRIVPLWNRMYEHSLLRGTSAITMAALSGLDIALWDILGKALGVPVSELLGAGLRPDPVPVYASGGLYATGKEIDGLRAELQRYVDEGFTGAKIKVGGATIDRDVERARIARETLGEHRRLMVDAVYSYELGQAMRFAKATEDLGIHYYEAPLRPTDMGGLRALRSATGIPIAGHEIATGPGELRDLIVSGVIGYAQFDATLCGGITEAMRTATLARAFHIPCSLHSSSTAVSFVANLHVAAATENLDSLEYHMVHRLLFEETGYDPKLDAQGKVPLPQGPGLGLDPTFADRWPAEGESVAGGSGERWAVGVHKQGRR